MYDTLQAARAELSLETFCMPVGADIGRRVTPACVMCGSKIRRYSCTSRSRVARGHPSDVIQVGTLAEGGRHNTLLF